MKTRLATFLTAALIVTTSGCSTLRTFWFGRGARCGLCTSIRNTLTPSCFGNAMQNPAPCNPAPCGPAVQSPGYVAPPVTYPSAPVYTPSATCAPSIHANPGGCGCGAPVAGVDCGCGGPVMSGYSSPVVVDPYQTGTIIDSSIDGGIISGDQFQARKFDANGDAILWEEPLPAGATLSN